MPDGGSPVPRQVLLLSLIMEKLTAMILSWTLIFPLCSAALPGMTCFIKTPTASEMQ